MSRYAPCPSCSCPRATPVSFTWWGGMLGPKMMTHVKCDDCGTAFNGKTGDLNTTGIFIYCAVTWAIVIAIVWMVSL